MIYLNTHFMKTIKIILLGYFCLAGFSALSADSTDRKRKEPDPSFFSTGTFERYVANDFDQETEPLLIQGKNPKRLSKKLRKTPFRVNFGEDEFTGREFQELAPLSSTLFGLDLSDQHISLEHLKDLPTFTQLRFLNLAGNGLKDEQMPPILLIGNLEHLILTYNKITTSGLASLLILKNLRFLDVSSIFWDNQKFITIIPLFTQLRGLKASCCNLDDVCLSSFKLLENLEAIDISGNRFSEKPLQEFLRYANSRNIKVKY
jgi:Leucine-rich repeat (LRR) protein